MNAEEPVSPATQGGARFRRSEMAACHTRVGSGVGSSDRGGSRQILEFRDSEEAWDAAVFRGKPGIPFTFRSDQGVVVGGLSDRWSVANSRPECQHGSFFRNNSDRKSVRHCHTR